MSSGIDRPQTSQASGIGCRRPPWTWPSVIGCSRNSLRSVPRSAGNRHHLHPRVDTVTLDTPPAPRITRTLLGDLNITAIQGPGNYSATAGPRSTRITRPTNPTATFTKVPEGGDGGGR